jgi:hypothetical protein
MGNNHSRSRGIQNLHTGRSNYNNIAWAWHTTIRRLPIPSIQAPRNLRLPSEVERPLLLAKSPATSKRCP